MLEKDGKFIHKVYSFIDCLVVKNDETFQVIVNIFFIWEIVWFSFNLFGDPILMKDSFEVSQENYGEYDILHPVPIQIFECKHKNGRKIYEWKYCVIIQQVYV